MHKSFLQYIDQIGPATDRIMNITLRGALPTTMVIPHMPQSDSPYEEKNKPMKDYGKPKENEGPLHLLGDRIARQCTLCPNMRKR